LFQIGAQRRANSDVAKPAAAPAAASSAASTAVSAPANPPPAARQEATGTLNTISAEQPAAAGEGN
jgi:hypothetical protein